MGRAGSARNYRKQRAYSRLGITENEAIPALEKLDANGVIDRDNMGFASCLTPEGYDLVKKGRADRGNADQIRELRLKQDL